MTSKQTWVAYSHPKPHGFDTRNPRHQPKPKHKDYSGVKIFTQRPIYEALTLNKNKQTNKKKSQMFKWNIHSLMFCGFFTWVSAKGHPDRGADGARISLRRLLTLVDVVGQVTNRG